jgi:hypothetical protein
MGQKIGLSLTDTKNRSGRNEIIETLAGYILYDHKTNDSISQELQIACILDKIDK